jgi:Flp pilus assembly protein TadG
MMAHDRPKRLRNQRGQSLLETAMMIIVIFVVVFWVFELAWLMYTHTVMADAANEGVRYAIVHSSDGSDKTPGGNPRTPWTDTSNIVKNFAKTSLHNTRGITVTVTPAKATVPNSVQVTVTYTYVPWLSRFISTPTMTTYAKGNLVQ